MCKSHKPVIIGLTGGIGSGKSTLANLLQSRGGFVIDADQLAREVVQKGSPALVQIAEHFGKEVLLEDGNLNRKLLGEMVFASPEKLALLGSLTHPTITKRISELICENWEHHFIVIDAALLIESGTTALCDKIIVVTAKRDTRVLRIIQRDHVNEEVALRRMDAQSTDAYRIQFANYTIKNDDDLRSLDGEIDKILLDIFGEKGN